MSLLFVDSAGWAAIADEADPAHAAAGQVRDAWLEEGGRLVTTDYVVDETLTLLRARLSLRAAQRWWARVEASGRVRIEWMNPDRAARARTWFFGWEDKGFSFTDCASFAVMRELGIRLALTTDAHFLQAGFEILPKPA